MDNKQSKILFNMLTNHFKLLDAIFKENGGELIIDKESLDNANISFYISREDMGNKIKLKLIHGKSPLYYDMFGHDN